jgi:hypothetical protein
MIATSYIAKVLGKGISYTYIISSISLALVSVFYVYTVGSYLKVNIYPLQHRVSYYEFFDAYIINRTADQLIIIIGLSLWLGLSLRGRVTRIVIPTIYGGIALLTAAANYAMLLDIIALTSIPIVLSVLLYDRFVSKKKLLHVRPNILFINYVAVLSTVAGIIGIIVSLAPTFGVRLGSFYVRNYPYDIFLLLSSFSPVLILLLISGFPIKVFIKEFMTKILRFKNKKTDLVHSNRNEIRPRFKIIFLLLFMILSIAIALVPHHPAVNKDNQQIGVDTDYYIQWVNPLIDSHDYKQFLQHAFITQSVGDRPLTLIFLFTIAKVTNANLFFIIEHLPVILGPALVLVIYFLTRQLTSNDTASLFSSFLTAISFQPLIGIYAGIYANWFALIIGYLSFVFLFRSLKRPVENNKSDLIIFGTLLILLLFSHLYTWSILVIISAIFLFTMLKLKRYSRRNIMLLLLIVLSCVVVDLFKTIAIGSAGGFEKDIEVAQVTGIGPEQFAQRFSNLMITLYTYVGGQFSNFIIFGLGLYWLLRSNLADASTIFLIICLSVGLFPFLLGNYIIQVRVFYDIPFQIPAAIALSSIWRRTAIPVLPICIFLLNATIMAVSNFYLIPLS